MNLLLGSRCYLLSWAMSSLLFLEDEGKQSLSIWSSQFLYVVVILPHDQDCMKNRVNYECESTI